MLGVPLFSNIDTERIRFFFLPNVSNGFHYSLHQLL